jgi:hypothetical protein
MIKSTCKNGLEHNWLYEHAVYESPQSGMPDQKGIYRQCKRCKKKQMAFTVRWRNPPKAFKPRLEPLC